MSIGIIRETIIKVLTEPLFLFLVLKRLTDVSSMSLKVKERERQRHRKEERER